jgi:L-rhamnose mutarotase
MISSSPGLLRSTSNTYGPPSTEQRVKNTWQPLALFSKKLNLAQQKYNAYDCELLAIYEAVKHRLHMVEVHHFSIFTDHKLLTYAFQQKQGKCSPRQLDHLDFIAQFMTDIQQISGQDNVVADVLSCVESIIVSSSYNALVTSQDSDNELQSL